MKRLHSTTAIAFLLLVLVQIHAQETRLSYNLLPGERYLLDIDLQQNTSSEVMNSADISLYSRTRIEFVVDSTDKLGMIHMKVRYRNLLLSMLAPGMNIDINSSSGKNTMLSSMVDSLSKGTFYMIMDGTGELKSLVGLEPLFECLA